MTHSSERRFPTADALRAALRACDPMHPAARDARIPIGGWFVHRGEFYELESP